MERIQEAQDRMLMELAVGETFRAEFHSDARWAALDTFLKDIERNRPYVDLKTNPYFKIALDDYKVQILRGLDDVTFIVKNEFIQDFNNHIENMMTQREAWERENKNG